MNTREPIVYTLPELAPPDYCDPVIEAYKKDVDRTLLRENLKLTVEERLQKAESFHLAIDELRQSGKRTLQNDPGVQHR